MEPTPRQGPSVALLEEMLAADVSSLAEKTMGGGRDEAVGKVGEGEGEGECDIDAGATAAASTIVAWVASKGMGLRVERDAPILR